jgi:MazG family protein
MIPLMKNELSDTFEELVRIMERLRAEDGCPWDREQTLDDLADHLQGELDEVKQAIAARDPENLAEELGDLMFNVVFTAEIARGEGWFTMKDVLLGIRDKIVRRHPHVFGDAEASTPEEVLVHWNRVKRQEKGEDG